jgi:predicted RNA-binding Zn-ribbon protein involved in translation (DUF1610 family)
LTVKCNRCGQSWPRDPALEVECPTCGAGIGHQCKRPSGHRASFHGARDLKAMDDGKLTKCAALPHDGPAVGLMRGTLHDIPTDDAEQPELF